MWLFLESSTGFADPQGMKRGVATFFVLLNLQSTFLLGKSHSEGVPLGTAILVLL